MRFPLLALLCAGTAAFCQSPAPQKIDPDKLFQMPEGFTRPAPDFKQFKPLPPMKHELILTHPTAIAPRPQLNNSQIDPKMIVHPPWHGSSKGQTFFRHLYPDLKFLPLQRGAPVPK